MLTVTKKTDFTNAIVVKVWQRQDLEDFLSLENHIFTQFLGKMTVRRRIFTVQGEFGKNAGVVW